MRNDRAGLRLLTRTECLALLPSAEVGRIAVSTQALPLILPVSFMVDQDRIVISTQNGTTLDTSTDNTVIAFQADGSSSQLSGGWSVHVTGIARHVTDLIEFDRLSALPPWVRRRPLRLVTISTDQMWGRLVADADGPFDQLRSGHTSTDRVLGR